VSVAVSAGVDAERLSFDDLSFARLIVTVRASAGQWIQASGDVALVDVLVAPLTMKAALVYLAVAARWVVGSDVAAADAFVHVSDPFSGLYRLQSHVM
jgi:hypothetical protein